MKYGRGFTIVELIVTITILIILTTLVVVRLSTTQVAGRDQEREIDATAIATGLEVYYQNGSQDGSVPKGYYPGTAQVTAAASTSPPFNSFLEGVPRISFEAPGRTISNSFGFVAATGTTIDGSFTTLQARTHLASYAYLYQPMRRNNTICANYTDCVRFNLYYLDERSNAVIHLKSKNQ